MERQIVFNMLKEIGVLPERHIMADKKAAKKSGRIGRPTKYNPNYPKIAEVLCREEGYTDDMLAGEFKVNVDTIYTWKRTYPDFSEAIQSGKDDFDTVKVESALLKRCVGYTYDETTKERRDPVFDDDGKVLVEGGLVVTKVVEKQVAPDVPGQKMWLTNRKSKRWSDKQELITNRPAGEKIEVDQIRHDLDELKEIIDNDSGIPTS